MKKLEFEHHGFPARKGLLDFLEEEGEENLLARIGENTKAWIEELNLISQVATGNPLVAGTGFFVPPTEDPDFQEIGDKAYFYTGEDSRSEGLWTRKDLDPETAELIGKASDWTRYGTRLSASVKINKEFAGISPEEFLPENFEQGRERLKDARKRPIWKVEIGGQDVYAKASEIIISKFYNHTKPSHRMTPLASIRKTTSKREMEITETLGNLGVNVPVILGYYEAPFEEFLFAKEVKGRQPSDFLDTHRREIIRQDAEMLATLCQAGYRKGYFKDFDDKIFDGKKLWLIDVDECSDLYGMSGIDFRKVLLDPTQKNNVRDFRKFQKAVFTGTLRDNIHAYQETLTPTDRDKVAYIEAFHGKLGWKAPSGKKLQDFLTFPKNYQTLDSSLAMMNDCD